MKKKTKRMLAYLLALSMILGNFAGTGKSQAATGEVEVQEGDVEGGPATGGSVSGGSAEPTVTPTVTPTAIPTATPTAIPTATPVIQTAITVSVTMNGWIYGDAAIDPSVVIKDDKNNEITDQYLPDMVSYTYYTDSECTKQTTAVNGAVADGKMPKNAGTYYVKVAVSAKENYLEGSGIAEFTISKRIAKIEWSKKEFIYTGETQSVTATVGNAVENDKFDFKYDGNEKIEVGTYKAKVTDLGNANYQLPQNGATVSWEIKYLETEDVSVSGTKGKNDWYTSDVQLVPAKGYYISSDKKSWEESLSVEGQGEHIIGYYLKQKDTSFITDEKSMTIKIDSEKPTGTIKIGEWMFQSLIKNSESKYKYFLKNSVDVSIDGDDSGSGIEKVEYKKVAKGSDYDEKNGWGEGENFTVKANEVTTIYAKITDNAGNETIISSDGIVVYTDSVLKTEKINCTKTSGDDVKADVSLNGNTIAAIKNGDQVLKTDDYTVENGKITLKNSYLSELEAGTYTLTISYNPCGEKYIVGTSQGQVPVESKLTLTVSKAGRKITVDASKLSKVYDGFTVDKPTVKTVSGQALGEFEVEYRRKGTENYVKDAPSEVGDYEVKVTVKADKDYGEGVATAMFSISPASMGVTATGSDGEYDGTAHGIQVSVSKPVKDYVVYYGTTLQDLQNKKTSPIQYTEAGTYTIYYQVVAANYMDFTASATVIIRDRKIQQMPSYTTKSTYTAVGQTVNFKVDVQKSSEVSLEYQWYCDGQRISGSTAELSVKVLKKGRHEYTCDVLYKASGKQIKDAGKWSIIGYDTKVTVLYKKTAYIKKIFGNAGAVSKISLSKKNKKKITVNAKKGTIKVKQYCKNVKMILTMDNGQVITVVISTSYPMPKLKAKKGALKSYVEGKYRTFYMKVSNVKGASKVRFQYSRKKNKGYKGTKMKKFLVKKGSVYYIRAVAYYGKIRSPYSKTMKIKG